MQNGGWYNNPATGRNQRWFNGVWTDGSEPSSSNSGGGVQKENADSVDRYIESLMGEAKGQRDLMLKKLDAEHKLALGNDDGQTAAFLESVSDALETKIGRMPYDYQRYTARELETYGTNSRNINDNRKLALDKLAMDERNLGQSSKENLNSRGLLTGQNPDDLDGTAGQQFDKTVTEPVGMERSSINLQADQMQTGEDFRHRTSLEDLKVDARRGAQDQQLSTQFGREGTNLEYDSRMKALERQRDELLRQSKILSGKTTGIQKGILGY